MYYTYYSKHNEGKLIFWKKKKNIKKKSKNDT